MVIAHPYPPAELENALRKVAQHEPLTQGEREMVLLAVDDTPAVEGGCVLTEEEADELERAFVEADEEDRAGKLIPIEDVLARLRAPSRRTA
jgi:hypothetical protein